ncbi:MAG: NADH-quinone oxidoreductase subunit L [Planctomycetota bacterium]
MSQIEILLVTGVLIPLAGFVLLAFFGSRLGKPLAGWVAVAAIAASTVLATVALTQWLRLDDVGRRAAQSAPYEWATFGAGPGALEITFGVNLDSLTIIMFFMVTLVSTCIFLFSVGYMAGHSDEIDGISKYHRFFTYLCLFDFSMLLLVIADSLLLLFIAWELVGLCSYLLIGFYFHKKSASNAAIKAFVTNRVGDFGFIVGLGMALLFLGNFSLAGAAESFKQQYVLFTCEPGTTGAPLFTNTFLGISYATWMGMLLFCGAIGKSAQFPLQVWLPDAMEGPTPVSALIHAATMVAAGVYLVARIFVLLTPGAQLFIAVIGCITLAIAALVAIVQTDIKKVLAYSTISQLGYMMLGMGVGAWIAALFHLLAHAFFKALMFLGSGQVIEGTHHEQDIRKMGGLHKKMPVTCWTFFVGVLAIAGAGIPAVWMPGHMPFGLGGYFSKDEILAVAWHRAWGSEAGHGAHAGRDQELGKGLRDKGTEGRRELTAGGSSANIVLAAFQEHGHGGAAAAEPKHEAAGHGGQAPAAAAAHAQHSDMPRWPWAVLFTVAVIMAYVTPFYMMRAWWLTFMGQPRDEHVYHHAHESPLMYIPLVVLAVGTFFSSYFLFRPLVAEAAPAPFITAAYDGVAASDAEAARNATMIDHGAHTALAGYVGFAFAAGFVLAWLIYRRGLAVGEKIAAALKPLHTLLEHKFYFDEAYGLVLVGGTHLLKNISYAFDKYVVDGLVNLSAWITERLSAFSGVILDQGVVDGAVNGVGRAALAAGGAARAPQVGRVRNYILFAAGSVAVVVICLAMVYR